MASRHYDTLPGLINDADEEVEEVEGMMKLLEEKVDFLLISAQASKPF